MSNALFQTLPARLLPDVNVGDVLDSSDVLEMNNIANKAQELRTGCGLRYSTFYSSSNYAYIALPNSGQSIWGSRCNVAWYASYASGSSTITTSSVANSVVYQGSLGYGYLARASIGNQAERVYSSYVSGSCFVFPEIFSATTNVYSGRGSGEVCAEGASPFVVNPMDAKLVGSDAPLSPEYVLAWRRSCKSSKLTPQIIFNCPRFMYRTSYLYLSGREDLRRLIDSSVITTYLDRTLLKQGAYYCYVLAYNNSTTNLASTFVTDRIDVYFNESPLPLQLITASSGVYCAIACAPIPAETRNSSADYVACKVALKTRNWNSTSTTNAWGGGSISDPSGVAERCAVCVFIAGKPSEFSGYNLIGLG